MSFLAPVKLVILPLVEKDGLRDETGARAVRNLSQIKEEKVGVRKVLERLG
jgi:glycyl-tRNA synthetase (class II)